MAGGVWNPSVESVGEALMSNERERAEALVTRLGLHLDLNEVPAHNVLLFIVEKLLDKIEALEQKVMR